MLQRAWSSRHRWLDAFDHAPGWIPLVLTAATLAGSYAVVVGSPTGQSVSRHLFYVPVVLAAVRFGAATGFGVAVLAMLLAGPVAGSPDPWTWVGYGAAFALVGVIVGGSSAAHARSSRMEQDVSARERELVAQRAALVQIISHELRTPLTILRGSVETLVERDSLARASSQELVLAMQRSVLRLQDMVDVALAAADELEIDASSQIDVDVRELVEHAASTLTPRLRRRLEFDIPAGASLVTVESQLWLTLRCLLDNADKFSPEDGAIRVGYRREHELAVILVEDDGPGLPEELGEDVFEPFVQADLTVRRRHPGLGLGLYTARRLARRLGGDVVLNSRRDHGGSLAEVRLPQRRSADHLGIARSSHGKQLQDSTGSAYGR